MKHFISILLISACSFFAKGQNTFHKLIYLEFPLTRFTSVLPTDSCFYVSGTFSDSISPLRTGVLLGKIDLQGELVTIKTIKHPDMWFFNDYCDLGVNPDGQLFYVGSVNDEPGSNNAIIYLYNEQGDTILTKKFNSILYPDFDFVLPGAAIASPSGGYAIASSYEAGESPHQSDLSLMLIDEGLQIVSHLSYANTPLYEIPASLLLDNNGGYIMGAVRSNAGQVLLNYLSRTLIIKTDSTSEQIWQWLSPVGVLQDEAKAMIKTPDGGLVVASGIGDEIGNNPNIHTLIWDALIFKLDSNRHVVWSTPLRGDLPNGNTELTEMVEATNGDGYVASGIVYEKEGTALGHYTSWLVKVSPEGDSLWARRYTYFDGEFVAPEVFDMKATPDGGYVLVGFTRNLFDIVTNPYIPAWIMMVDSFGCLIPGCHLPDATFEEGRMEVQISIYPNPASDFLNFYYRSPRPGESMSWRVVNGQGQVVGTIGSAQPGSTVMLPIRDWPPGVYFLQCVGREGILASEKFVKL